MISAADIAHSPEGRELLFDHGWGALHEAYTLTGENAALMQLVADDRFIGNALVTFFSIFLANLTSCDTRFFYSGSIALCVSSSSFAPHFYPTQRANQQTNHRSEPTRLF
jgi:hypothetical protein